jgi:hypothetical protein
VIPFNGHSVEIPGARTLSYLDNAKIAPQITDSTPRTRRIRAIVLHTTSGTATGKVAAGSVASTRAEVLARYQTRTERKVSWDVTIDLDGDVIVQNDVVKNYSWHATAWNSLSMGIELVQGPGGVLYADQIAALVAVVDFYTMALGIQRQIAWAPEANGPCLSRIPRADEHGKGGQDMVGIFAHCHNTNSRGPGDPGAAPFLALADAGYDRFDYRVEEDKQVWRGRQSAIGCATIDGIPLTETCRALEKKNGSPVWVTRPNDAAIISLVSSLR